MLYLYLFYYLYNEISVLIMNNFTPKAMNR